MPGVLEFRLGGYQAGIQKGSTARNHEAYFHVACTFYIDR